MKTRSTGFLAKDKIDHDGEIFDYIRELHQYLWCFVRIAHPGAGGMLSDCVDSAIYELTRQRAAIVEHDRVVTGIRELIAEMRRGL